MSAYLKGRTRDTNVENGLVDTVGEGEGGTSWESTLDCTEDWQQHTGLVLRGLVNGLCSFHTPEH